MTPRRKLIIGGGVTLAVALIPAALAAVPSWYGVMRASAEARKNASVDARSSLAADRWADLREHTWPQVNAAAAAMIARVPVDEAPGDRLLVIQRCAAAAGVVIEAASEEASGTDAGEEAQAAGPLGAIDVDVSFRASPTRLRAFVEGIESGARLVNIRQFRVERSDDLEKGLIGRLTVAFSVWRSPPSPLLMKPITEGE